MANTDFPDLMADPDLMQRFVVTRRTQTTDEHGRVLNPQTWMQTCYGIVTPLSGRTMRMMPDLVDINNVIEIYSKFRIEGPSETTQADTITYNGQDYTVNNAQAWTGWGSGFTHAVATLKPLLASSPDINRIAKRGL